MDKENIRITLPEVENLGTILDRLNRQFSAIDSAIKVYCQYRRAEIDRLAKAIINRERKSDNG